MNDKNVGYVIAVDGPDGVGKTTQVTLLADYLRKQGRTVQVTRNSGGTPIGEELRKASLSNNPRSALTDLYISLAMGTALAEDVAQRKQHGETIIIDRSPLAIVAYQGYGSELEDKSKALEACEQLFKGLGIDLLIFLDAEQDILNVRREHRHTTDYFEQKDNAFHQRVRQGYQTGLSFLKTHSEIGPKIVSIDASTDIQTIQANILQALDSLTTQTQL